MQRLDAMYDLSTSRWYSWGARTQRDAAPISSLLKGRGRFHSISLFPSRIVFAEEHRMLSPGIQTDMLPLADDAENK